MKYDELIISPEGKKILKQLENQEEYYDYRYSAATQALINTNYAVSVLRNYVYYVPQDQGSMIKGLYYFFVKAPGNLGYTCIGMIPPTEKLNKFKGDCMQNKADALKSMAFKYCIQLKKLKKLDDEFKNQSAQYFKRDAEDEADDVGDLNDTDYVKILQKNIIKEITIITTIDKQQREKTTKNIKKLYPSYINQSLSFSFINPLYRELEIKTCQLSLYLIQFSDQFDNLKTKNLNYPHEQFIGFLHCLPHPIQFPQFWMAELRENYCKLKLIDSHIEVTEEEYSKLRTVHLYLISVAQQWETYFISIFADVPIKKDGFLYKKMKRNKSIEEDQDKSKFALLTLIHQTKYEQWEIDWNQVNSLMDFIQYLKQVFIFLNNLKENRHNKTFKSEKVTVQTELIKRFNQTYNYEDHDNFLILHSISEKKSFIKCILKEAKKIVEIEPDVFEKYSEFQQNYIQYKEQKSQPAANQGIKQEIKNDFDKHQYQYPRFKRIYFLEQNYQYTFSKSDMLVDIKSTRQSMKDDVNYYLKRSIKKNAINKQIQVEKVLYFPEFAIVPLNFSTVLKLKLIVDFLMFQIRDFLLADHFKHNIVKPLAEQKKKLIESASQQKYYSYTLNMNYLIGNCNKITKFMSQQIEEQSELSHLKTLFTEENITEKILMELKLKAEPQINDNNWNEFNINPQFFTQIDTQLIFKVLTSQMYNHYNPTVNYECYEFLGDTVLQLLATIQIFCQNPNINEEQIHLQRATIIKNNSLQRTGVKKFFFQYLFTQQFESTAPSGFIIVEDDPSPQQLKEAYGQKDEAKMVTQIIKYFKLREEPTDGQLYDEELKKCPENYKHLPDKVIADVIEALVGVYYEKRFNINDCQFLLYSLDILQYPTTKVLFKNNEEFKKLAEITINCAENPLIQKFSELNKQILPNYQFKNIGLLVQAFTHSSFKQILDNFRYISQFQSNLPAFGETIDSEQSTALESFISFNEPLTEFNHDQFSYERLQSLGDAVLDLLIVEWLNNKNKSIEPGELTDMKQSVVNNQTLALVSVSLNFHDFILIDKPTVFENAQQIQGDFDKYYKSCDELYHHQFDSDAIKILGDLFEAFVGAIFFDSHFNYELTQNCIMPLIEQQFVVYFISEDQRQKLPQNQVKIYFKQKQIDVTLEKDKINSGKYGLFCWNLRVINSEGSTENSQIYFTIYSLDQNEAYETIYKYIQRDNKIKFEQGKPIVLNFKSG